MTPAEDRARLDEQIAHWRLYLRRRRAINGPDVAELEDHLRDQVTALTAAGLDTDEAFLVAVTRMGSLDALSREFAREHSERLWKQLVASPGDTGHGHAASGVERLVVLGLAVAAALAFMTPALFGIRFGDAGTEAEQVFYARNISLFTLPFLAVYFAWKREIKAVTWAWLAAAFAAAAVFANIYPFPISPDSQTQVLAVIHTPMALWAVIGMAYVGGPSFAGGRRMDFVRFSGELFIYFVLIALGGGVLTAFTVAMFQSIDVDPEWFVGNWLVPCGAMGAVLVASWLVEATQSVIKNMAPVLTRLFTPLVTLLLLAFLVTLAWTGHPINIERNVLIAFDLLLVLVVDIGALTAIAARITEFGFTPNRVAALGENLILLVNLTRSAWLYWRFIRSDGSFAALERWQTSYLPVYSAWAAIVVIVFPLMFGFR